MKENLDFSYNGKLSTDFGIINVKVDNGLFKEKFIADKSIIEKKIQGRSIPYYQGIDRSPLSFDLTLYFQDGFTDSDLDDVKRWLDLDTYEEFYFLNNSDKIAICQMVGSSELYHTGTGQGYIDVSFRCNDAYIYSPEYLDNVIDLSNNISGNAIIDFENKGNVDLYPEIWCEVVSGNSFSITNTSNNGIQMSFSNLSQGETVYIDCFNEDIVSSIPSTYRFSNFSGDFLQFIFGVNHLNVVGQVKIQFRYRYRFK